MESVTAMELERYEGWVRHPKYEEDTLDAALKWFQGSMNYPPRECQVAAFREMYAHVRLHQDRIYEFRYFQIIGVAPYRANLYLFRYVTDQYRLANGTYECCLEFEDNRFNYVSHGRWCKPLGSSPLEESRLFYGGVIELIERLTRGAKQ